MPADTDSRLQCYPAFKDKNPEQHTVVPVQIHGVKDTG